MEIYLIVFMVLLTAIIMKSQYEKKAAIEKLRRKLKKDWGDVPNETYTSEKLSSIKEYYNQFKNENTDVDDITWNDINMNQIFMTVNNTCSALGEEYLYAALRKLVYDSDVLTERNRLIEFFQKQEEERIRLQVIFTEMGKVKDISVYAYMNLLHSVPEEDNAPHYLMMAAMFAAFGLIFVNPAMGILLSLGVATMNIIKYFKRKMQIEKYYTVVSYIIRLLKSVDEIEKLNIPEVKEYTKKMKDTTKGFSAFKKGARIVAPKKASGDVLEVFMDYFRMLFHFDLIKFNNMMKTFQASKEDINTLFETIGLLDAMIATASFRELMEVYCTPVLKHSSKPFLYAKELYHPMLNEPVKSSIHEDYCVLITGSNASGKSTFIKNLAINAILAQTLYTVMADSYEAPYFKIASSMALTDNLFNNESYYIVEIKSLKRIIDRLDDAIPTLCFVDEVLRGTNTLERIAASSRILHSFAKANAMCFAATHDIELTYILEKFYSNYHFQEQIKENEILFDYILYKGRAQSKNAIKLLSIIGYNNDIIDKAMDAANYFLETGEWQMIES